MLNNSNKKLKKIIISLLILTLTYSNFVLVGSNAYKGLISYAVDDNEIINNEPDIQNQEDDEIICEVLVESRDIHKTKMEEETEFTENLQIHLKNVSNVLVEDVESSFYNNEEIETQNAKLKYVKTTINKEELKSLLGDEGTLNVLDNEGDYLAKLSLEYINELEEMEEDEPETPNKFPQTFTKIVELENEEGEIVEEEQEEIRSYVSLVEDNIEVIYELETSKISYNIENIKLTEKNEDNIDEVKEINFVIENTKSIFDVEDLDSLNYLKENKTYIFNIEENEENSNSEEETEKPNVEKIIKFKDTITKATLETQNLTWTMGEANKVNYRIVLDTSSDKAELYKNPTFLLVLPECVESVNTENSKFTVENDGGVFFNKQVDVFTFFGRKCIVIRLEGEQTENSIQNGDTVINLSLQLNIKNTVGTTQTQTLYYYNVTSYENGEGKTDEINVSLVPTSHEQQEVVENKEVVEELPNAEEPEIEEFEWNQVNEETIENNENTLNYMDVRIIGDKLGDLIKVGDEYYYYIYVHNLEYDFSGFTIKNTIPDGLELIDAKLYGYNSVEYDYTNELNTQGLLEYNSQTKELKLNIENIGLGTSVLKIKVKANTLAEKEYSKEIVNSTSIFKGEELIEKEEVKSTISDTFLQINKKGEVAEKQVDEKIEYELEIKNLGKFESEEKTIKIKLPNELKPGVILIKQIVGDYALTIPMESNEEEIVLSIEGEETLDLKIIAYYETEVAEDLLVKAIVKIDNEDFEWKTKLLKTRYYLPNEDGSENENKPDEQNEPTNPTTPEDEANLNEEIQEKAEFDLSLAQNLKKITVTNKAGTSVYEYKDNTSFAKIEIPAKYMDGSQVTFEYEITVKNEGTIEGYARKIADYVPKGLSFNSELNPDWYVGDDGNLYSVALIDKLLKPEDTATLKLVLTKKMTTSNTGTIENLAEIYEATNELNIQADNKQNDMAKVEVLIAVKTGEIVTYLMLWIMVFTILIYGTHKTKKILLNKKGGC